MKTTNVNTFPDCLKMATSTSEIDKIWRLRESEYRKHYENFSEASNDPYDENAYIFYSQNQQEIVTSTGRIILDGKLGLPSDELLKSQVDELRNKRRAIAELSKFTIAREARGLLPYYVKTFYELAVGLDIESLIFICKSQSARVYQGYVGANILLKDINYSYGTQEVFSLLEWKISNSAHYFYKWNKEAA